LKQRVEVEKVKTGLKAMESDVKGAVNVAKMRLSDEVKRKKSENNKAKKPKNTSK